MKFRYVGVSEFRDLDLVLNGVMTEKDVLIYGTVFEVSDTKRELIGRLKINGNYEVVPEKPKVTRKPKKGKKRKEEDKEED